MTIIEIAEIMLWTAVIILNLHTLYKGLQILHRMKKEESENETDKK